MSARNYLLMIFVLTSSPALAEDGQWSKADPFIAKSHAVCYQVWTCGPKGPILHDPSDHLVTVPNKGTFGTCSVGDGSYDSCNECLAQPPDTSCEYYFEHH